MLGDSALDFLLTATVLGMFVYKLRRLREMERKMLAVHSRKATWPSFPPTPSRTPTMGTPRVSITGKFDSPSPRLDLGSSSPLGSLPSLSASPRVAKAPDSGSPRVSRSPRAARD